MVSRVLITGGLGYVGGRIAEHLSNSGKYEVFVTTRRPISTAFPGMNTVVVDSTLENYGDYLRNIDMVIHLAAMNEIDCVKHPYDAIDVNIKQSLKCLNAATEAKVSKFVYFSTMHVYGSPLAGLIHEGLVTQPAHPYSITHKAAEDYVLAARKQTGIDGIVFRLSNAFGAPLFPDVNRWTLLVNDLCRQAIEKRNLTLLSDGTQLRDFITLTDVCLAVEYFLSLEKVDTKDGLFNLCGENTMSVYDMAEQIAQTCNSLFGYTPPINKPRPEAVTSKMSCSAEKLRSTGFSLRNNVQDELEKMLIFCNQHFSTL